MTEATNIDPKDTKENYSLIADIGGTNTRLQLISFTQQSKTPNQVKSTFYKNINYSSFSDCLKDFVKEFEGTDKYPHNATIAIAAAPFNNKVKMVNCPHWPEMDGFALGKEFNIHPFNLINDFEAIGYSLLKIPDENKIKLNDANKFEGKPMAVAGSGTGLGECVLHASKGNNYYVCPTEGGHKDFAPTDKIDHEFLQFCLEEVPKVKEMGYLSVERSFCGPAIPAIYRFFCKREGIPQQKIEAEDIFQKGLKKEDPICEKVLEFYARLYGKEIGNFACDCLPYGGIYLVGGMINSVADYFIKDETCPFLKAYLSKDKVTNNVLARFPIYIVKYSEPGLLGAFVKAQIDAYSNE